MTTALYVPGTSEKDMTKVIMSAQLVAGQAAANTDAIATLNAATYVNSIAGNSGAFTLNSTSGITNTTNDIKLSQATSSQFGAVKVDGTTITASSGVISAVSPVLLNTLTASNSATLSDTTSLTSTYSTYELVFQNIVPATATVSLELQVHSGGAFKSTSYLTDVYYILSGGTASAQPTTFIPLTNANLLNASPGASGTIRVYKPSSSDLHMWAGQITYVIAGPVTVPAVVGGFWNSAAAIDGFQVLASAGNLTSGVIKIYGIT